MTRPVNVWIDCRKRVQILNSVGRELLQLSNLDLAIDWVGRVAACLAKILAK